MEVAAALPRLLKVFPLRVTARNDLSALKQASELAPKIVEEDMEEGDICASDACRDGGGFKWQLDTHSNVAVPNPHSSISEANSASVTHAAPHSTLISAMTGNLHSEHSIYVLLSLPDKLSSQGQGERISLRCPCLPASSPVKKHRGLSPLKRTYTSPAGQATALLQASLLVKQYSSPSKLSATNQFPLLKPCQANSPSQPSSLICSPMKPVEGSLPPKKLQASSPQLKQCLLSSALEASSHLKASPQAKQPQVTLHVEKLQSLSPQSKWSQLSQPTDGHFEAPLQYKGSSPEAKQSQAAAPLEHPRLCDELCALQAPLFVPAKDGPSHSSPHISSPLKQYHQATSLPNLSHPAGSVSGRKLEDSLGVTSIQPGLPTSPERYGERALVTCVNGKRRPRSSAVRDYPDGCVSAKALKVQGEQGTDYASTSATGQERKEQQLVLHQEANYQCPAQTMEDAAALCLIKSGKTSVPFPTRKFKFSLKRKQDATSVLHHKALKKVKNISHILTSADLSPLTAYETRTQKKWLQDSGYEQATSEENLVQLDNRISQTCSLSARAMYAKKTLEPMEDVDKLLAIVPNAEVSARALVRKTLQEFDFVRRSLAVCKDGHQRPDLAAARILKTKGRWRNCHSEKIVGEVPGVEVGDQFRFRIEMLIVGLHRQTQGGIDFITGNVRPEGPLATSIVASGGYEDDNDCGDTFIYTGQGGNNYKGDRRQACDQVLTRGNLALTNSYKEKSPVRVIRGSTDDKFYTYDGLYDVVDCWFQTGAAGFGVYQFKLCRRPGQPELYSSFVKFMGKIKKKGLPRANLLMGDISQGKETLPICVVNEVDEEVVPQYFTYIPKMKYPSWYSSDISEGCGCVGGCVDASKCLCAAKNGGEFPYNELGQIIIGKKVVFECGKSCACSSSCHNRVSQKGPRHQLEVFKTEKRGWGVRSLESIVPGDFICEYVGELLSDADAEQRIECDEYLFDIGNKTNTWSDMFEFMDVTTEKALVPIVEDVGYTIDARLFGGVARFINHSCSPNLFAQNVVYDSDDLRFPHVTLFSMENIPPMRELSYDYNYTVGYVRDAHGNVKSKACYCGTQDCRGRLY